MESKSVKSRQTTTAENYYCEINQLKNFHQNKKG